MTGEMIFVAIIIILMLIGLSFEVIRADFLIFLALVSDVQAKKYG